MIEQDGILLEKSVVVNGKRWYLYSVEFKTVDGTYSSYIYALSEYHANVLLSDLKSYGKVTGQIV